MKVAVLDKLFKAMAKIVAPPVQAPPPAPAPEEPPRRDIARLLFDAHWYVRQHPDAPVDDEEAYKYYLANGKLAGHRPSPLFADLRFPARAKLSQEHLFRVTSSPILSRVPPARYLELYRFRTKRTVHRPSSTLAEYLQRAMIKPDLIGPDLTEYDLRIVAYMDGEKKRVAAQALGAPQADLVSIVLVPAHGAELLADTIASVEMQSYENWELIIASTGGSQHIEAITGQFNDDRIKLAKFDQHLTPGEIRNACIEQASGSIIAYLNEDSIWDPDCLLILLNRMRASGARASYGAQVIWDRFDPDSRLGSAFVTIRFSPFNRSLTESRDYLSTTVLIHDRALLNEIGLFNISLPKHLDWEWITRLTEVTRPEAVPCLVGHSFQASGGRSAAASEDEASSLLDAWAKLVERSKWSQPFMTTDGTEHLAFSTSRKTLEIRRGKLARLPSDPVQILIPNYESLAELEMCLASIAEHTLSPYSILIIDNGSADATYARLESMIASFEHTRLIRETTAAGFSFAVNRGLKEIADKNEKILILNNDTLATPDWLDELRYVLFKHDSAAMAVPRQVIPAGAKAARLHMPAAKDLFEIDINLSTQHDNVLDSEFDREDNIVELNFAPLFCSLIRPEAIKALGGLDSGNGPHYRSDWILCEAIRRVLKQKILYTPHSKVYHLQGVATKLRGSSTQVSAEPSGVHGQRQQKIHR